jgi:hypothetical protein
MRWRAAYWHSDKGWAWTAPPGDPGRGVLLSVAVAASVGARPDEAEGLFAAFDYRVVKEVGVDRRGEARVVELEAQVVTALGGAFGPGGTDLRPTDKDAVGGGIAVRRGVFGHNADVLRLHAEGDDFSDVFAAGLLEGSDGGHVMSPFGLSEPALIAASMAIVRTGAIRRRSPSVARSASGGRQGRSFLFREEWRLVRQGKKVRTHR